MVRLGDRVKDDISGFEGIAVARSEYLYGCVRVCVEPMALHEGRLIESQWFDEQRLTKTSLAKAGGPGAIAPGRDAPRP